MAKITEQITFEGLTYNLDEKDRVAAQVAIKDATQSTQYKLPIVNATEATLAPTLAQSGTIFTLNRAGGITVTLPAAEAGLVYEFHVGTTFTGNMIINAASDADTLQGVVQMHDKDEVGSVVVLNENIQTSAFAIPAAADHQLVADGDTKGRFIGGHIVYKCITDSKWSVSGHLFGDGNAATPFT